MSFINEFISLVNENEAINKEIISLQFKKEKLTSSLNKLAIKIVRDFSIEDIIIFIKEICIKQQQRRFSINFYGNNKIYFSIYLEDLNKDNAKINRTINFEDKKIELILDTNDSNWLMFNINNQTNLGFYLRLFDINLSDIDTTELDSIDLESYKYIINFMENNIFK